MPSCPAFANILNALLVVGLLAAVAFDTRSRRIPNLLTFTGAALGLGINTAADGWSGLAASLGGLGLGMALLMPVWLAGGTGAGDVKLLGMVGAMRGAQFVLWTGLFGAVAGGVLALIALAYRRQGMGVLQNVGAYLYRVIVLGVAGPLEPTSGSFRMSYAIAIATGALAAALYL